MLGDNLQTYGGPVVLKPQVPQPAQTPAIPGGPGRWGGGQLPVTPGYVAPRGPLGATNPAMNSPQISSKYDAATGTGPAPAQPPAGTPNTPLGQPGKYSDLIKNIESKQASEWGGDSYKEVNSANGQWVNKLERLDSIGIDPRSQPLDLVKAFVRGDYQAASDAYFKMMQNLSPEERQKHFVSMYRDLF